MARPDDEGEAFMSDQREDQERPCLHCLIDELIDDFFAEYPPARVGQTRSIQKRDEIIEAVGARTSLDRAGGVGAAIGSGSEAA